MKDLFIQYRGQIAAYDEGLVKSDAVLATALWRNIFDAKPDVSFTKLALVTSYVRRILAGLDKVEDETVCAARLTFGDPRNEAGVVAEESRLVKELEAMPMENGRAPKGGQVTEINPA